MYTNYKNTFYALILLSFAFAGSVNAMKLDSDDESTSQEMHSATEASQNDINPEAASNPTIGWFSSFRNYLPSPMSYLNNLRNYEYREKARTAINNLRNYEYREKVNTAVAKYFYNFKNDRKTQVGTAAAVLAVGTAAYAGHKYYKNIKAKKLAAKVSAEKAIEAAQQVPAENEIEAAQQVGFPLEQAWRNLLNELFSTLEQAQYANCPAIYEVFLIGGVDNPNFFRDNEEVWAILTKEQQDVLSEVIKLYEAALEVANVNVEPKSNIA